MNTAREFYQQLSMLDQWWYDDWITDQEYVWLSHKVVVSLNARVRS